MSGGDHRTRRDPVAIVTEALTMGAEVSLPTGSQEVASCRLSSQGQLLYKEASRGASVPEAPGWAVTETTLERYIRACRALPPGELFMLEAWIMARRGTE